jgi:hypothetical protein
MSTPMATWLTWSGVSTVVGVVAAYAVGAVIQTSIETGIVLFAIGCMWSAATPKVLRIISRRLRG